MTERGSASIVLASGALLLCLSALAVADLGSMVVARARAHGAAEDAALAAVVRQAPVLGQGDDPERAAREAAEENGASLHRCDCAVGTPDATVEVEVIPKLSFLRGWFGRHVRATARANLDADVLTYRASPSPSPSP